MFVFGGDGAAKFGLLTAELVCGGVDSLEAVVDAGHGLFGVEEVAAGGFFYVVVACIAYEGVAGADVEVDVGEGFDLVFLFGVDLGYEFEEEA